MKKAILIYFVLVLGGCKEISDFYMGLPLQPRFEENSFTSGLNIFGVLRPDSTGSFNNSFIQIEKVVPAVGKADSFNVDTVLVTVGGINSEQEFNFALNSNSIFSQNAYRPEGTFIPKPGEMYSLTCELEDFPVLLATTIIPNKAELVKNSIQTGDNYLSFEIKNDTSIFMLDVYCYSGDTLYGYNRFAAESQSNTLIEMSIDGNKIKSIVVYSYDYNMAKYYLTSNTSLNFNKYRNSYSTVENGYGVFGSVNKNFFKIK
jgi:hypothetical protein